MSEYGIVAKFIVDETPPRLGALQLLNKPYRHRVAVEFSVAGLDGGDDGEDGAQEPEDGQEDEAALPLAGIKRRLKKSGAEFRTPPARLIFLRARHVLGLGNRIVAVISKRSSRQVKTELRAIKKAGAEISKSPATARAFLRKNGFITRANKVSKRYRSAGRCLRPRLSLAITAATKRSASASSQR